MALIKARFALNELGRGIVVDVMRLPANDHGGTGRMEKIASLKAPPPAADIGLAGLPIDADGKIDDQTYERLSPREMDRLQDILEQRDGNNRDEHDINLNRARVWEVDEGSASIIGKLGDGAAFFTGMGSFWGKTLQPGAKAFDKWLARTGVGKTLTSTPASRPGAPANQTPRN